MSGNKLIAQNTVILYVKLLVSSIVGLFTARYTIEALGLSDFGLYSIVGGIVSMFAFINTIMVAATYRFIAFEIGKKEDGNVNKIFNICFSIHAILAVLVLILNEIFGVYYVHNYLNVDVNKIHDAVFVLRLSTLSTAVTILSIPNQGLLTAKEIFFFRSIVEIIRSFLVLGIAIFLINTSKDKLIIFATLIAIANVIPAVFYFFYCKTYYTDEVKLKIYKDKSSYKEILSFTSWNILGAASVVGQSTGTPIIINSFFGTKMNAAFSIGNQVNQFISQFSMNLAQAAVPQITKNYSSGNVERSISIVSYTSKYTWFLMLFPVLPILLETKFLLNIWLVEVPNYAIEFTRLLVIYTLANGLGNGIGTIIQATGKIKIFQLVLSTTTLIGLPIGYYMYYIGNDATVIIYVFIITALINVVSVQVLLNKLIKFDVKSFFLISYARILYVILALVPLNFVSYFLPESFLRFCINSVLSILWLIISIYFFGIDTNEREYINKSIVKIRNKIFYDSIN